MVVFTKDAIMGTLTNSTVTLTMVIHAMRTFPRSLRPFSLVLISALSLSCGERPTEPVPSFKLEDPKLLLTSTMKGAPGEALDQPIVFRALDNAGRPVTDASVHWAVSGRGAQVTGQPWTLEDGSVRGIWILGTDARELQSLSVIVRRPNGTSRSARVSATAIPHRVARIRADSSHVTMKVGESRQLSAIALDQFGNTFHPDNLALSSLDSVVVSTSASDGVTAVSRGESGVVISDGEFGDTVAVSVIQVVGAIDPGLDSIVFSAVGAVRRIAATLVDDLGLPVYDSLPQIDVGDTAVLAILGDDPLAIRSIRPGRTFVSLTSGPAASRVPVVVRQVPASISIVSGNRTFDAIGDTVRMVSEVRDSAGTLIPDIKLSFASAHPDVATIDESGLLRAIANGSTAVLITAGPGVVDSISITVEQAVARVVPTTGHMIIPAIGASHRVSGVVEDRLGNPIADAPIRFRSESESIVSVDPAGLVTAVRPGATRVSLIAGRDSATVVVNVRQRAHRLTIERSDTSLIMSGAAGDPVPLSCRAFDSNDHLIEGAEIEVMSERQLFAGTTCATLQFQNSGVDSIRFRLDEATGSIALTVGVLPGITSPGLERVRIDSFPTGVWAPWAPTLRRNSRGETELYLALYPFNGSYPESGANLHRFVSSGDGSFRYDGIALRHGDPDCHPNGSGIENVFVMPRADAPGWRMLFAAGSFSCYGWQVFSAVSEDERNWTIEPGVRVSNLNPLVPQPPGGSGWPVGEGMDIQQLPNGTWRMLVGGFEPLEPREERYQIVEWTSTDQLTWNYQGTIFSTRQMPPEGESVVYAPNVREIAPGLFRMMFAGDNRYVAGGKGSIFTALSTDKVHWQFESTLISDVVDFKYVTVLDDLLITLRRTPSGAYEPVSGRLTNLRGDTQTLP